MTDVTNVEYRVQWGNQYVTVSPVELDLSTCTPDDLLVLSYLSEAVDIMNQVHWKIHAKSMFTIVPVLARMLESDNLAEEERAAIENYRTVLFAQNMPYSRNHFHNHLLDLPKDRAIEIMSLLPPSLQILHNSNSHRKRWCFRAGSVSRIAVFL